MWMGLEEKRIADGWRLVDVQDMALEKTTKDQVPKVLSWARTSVREAIEQGTAEDQEEEQGKERQGRRSKKGKQVNALDVQEKAGKDGDRDIGGLPNACVR